MSTTAIETLPPNGFELTDRSEDQSIAALTVPSSTDDYPKGLRLVAITVALVLSIFLSALDSTIIATLIPEITNVFDSLNQVGWYGSAYAMTNAAFLSMWGKAYSYFPLKGTFCFCVALFELGNLLCGFATSSEMLIAGRAIAGAGGAGNMTGCFIIIAYAVKPERRALFFGVLGVTFAIASICGPLLGGLFVDQASWRWGFWINVPFAVLAATMMTLSFQTPGSAKPRAATIREKALNLDLAGVLLVLSAMACFILSMHYIGTAEGWSNKTAILYFAGSVALTFLFILVEYRMESMAMMQLRFLKRRRFLGNCVYVFFLAGLYFPLLFSLPIQFQSINNQTASESGLRLIPLVLGISVFTMVSNFVITHYPRHTALLVSGALLGVLGASLISIVNENATTITWVIFELIAAAGIGLALQIPMISNQASVPAVDIPTATSMTLFFETAGQALFTAAGEAALINRLIKDLAARPVQGIDPRLVMTAGATGFRKHFNAEQVDFILGSYLDALKVNHLLSLGCGVAAATVSVSMIAPVLKDRLQKQSRNR